MKGLQKIKKNMLNNQVSIDFNDRTLFGNEAEKLWSLKMAGKNIDASVAIGDVDRDGLMSMYQDGTFLASTDISNIGDMITSEGLFFGTDTNSAFDFSGLISEVRVWNTVRYLM